MYSPPASGSAAPSSAYASAPHNAIIAPAIQVERIVKADPKSRAIKPVVVKMPVPTMFATTTVAALRHPIPRTSGVSESANIVGAIEQRPPQRGRRVLIDRGA